MRKRVVIIGGGPAGMRAATVLRELGCDPVIIEKDSAAGGKLRDWDTLFPTFEASSSVLSVLEDDVAGVEIMTDTEVRGISGLSGSSGHEVELDDGTRIPADAVILATGYELFPAEKKEEYGYGLYEHVYTSADLEVMAGNGSLPAFAEGHHPRIAFVHCVGSRDEKAEQRHCSKVCCVTGVKQAIKLKSHYPGSEVYNFYMDMRMFGPGYEEMYRRAQEEFNIHFIRGRVSEAARTIDGRIQVKAEDTLIGRPIKLTVDMLVLLVGMTCGGSNERFAAAEGVGLAANGFFQPADPFNGTPVSGRPGVFYAGTATSPKTIGESIADATDAAYRVYRYLMERDV